jgi:hypothetical protein
MIKINRRKITEAHTSEEIVLEYSDSDKYEFPFEDKVPEGCYYSMITVAEKSFNKYSDPCFDICYKLVSNKDLDALDAGYIDKLAYCYIRQRYKIGSEPERKFVRTMCESGMPAKFKLSELVGYTEYIRLTYVRDGCIGSITERITSDIDPAYFTDDELE